MIISKIRIPMPLFVIISSALFMLLYNMNWINNMAELGGGKLTAACLVFVEGLIFWYIVAINRYLFAILSPILFTLSAMCDYFIKYYKIDLSYSAIGLFFKTNITEASGLVETELVLKMLVGLLLGIIFAIIRFKAVRHESMKSVAIWFVVFSILLAVSKPIESRFSDTMIKGGFQFIPVAYLEKTYHYIRFQRMISKSVSQKLAFDKENISYSGPDEMTVVLIISDALRVKNMELYGYEKKTTPDMAAMDLIAYPPAFACADVTYKSVPCLISRATRANPDAAAKENSVVSLFKNAGFYTAWVSNQGEMGRSDLTSTIVSKEADYSYFNPDINRAGIEKYDRLLMSEVEKAISSDHKKKLIIFHMIGSHWPYILYYPQKDAMFKPECTESNPAKCPINELVNAYDNTVLENDRVFASMAKMLEGKNAMILFTSDHGELLGEYGGRTLHGSGTLHFEEVRKVPFVLWFSKKFTEINAYANALKNKTTDVSHDNVFHSLAGCSGIGGSYIDDKLNVCSPGLQQAVDLFGDTK